jgi:cyclic pyranopterin phosphate synthase
MSKRSAQPGEAGRSPGKRSVQPKGAQASAGRSSHFDAHGRARMVDVGAKPITQREAIARGRVQLSQEAFRAVAEGTAAKGDVLGIARIAGIQAAKRTADWIPLAHPLPLEAVELDFECVAEGPHIDVEARARTSAKTGVEMEALVAVSAAALTIYDMCKSIGIDAIQLVKKTGGKSGTYVREEE